MNCLSKVADSPLLAWTRKGSTPPFITRFSEVLASTLVETSDLVHLEVLLKALTNTIAEPSLSGGSTVPSIAPQQPLAVYIDHTLCGKALEAVYGRFVSGEKETARRTSISQLVAKALILLWFSEPRLEGEWQGATLYASVSTRMESFLSRLLPAQQLDDTGKASEHQQPTETVTGFQELAQSTPTTPGGFLGLYAGTPAQSTGSVTCNANATLELYCALLRQQFIEVGSGVDSDLVGFVRWDAIDAALADSIPLMLERPLTAESLRLWKILTEFVARCRANAEGSAVSVCVGRLVEVIREISTSEVRQLNSGEKIREDTLCAPLLLLRTFVASWSSPEGRGADSFNSLCSWMLDEALPSSNDSSSGSFLKLATTFPTFRQLAVEVLVQLNGNRDLLQRYLLTATATNQSTNPLRERMLYYVHCVLLSSVIRADDIHSLATAGVGGSGPTWATTLACCNRILEGGFFSPLLLGNPVTVSTEDEEKRYRSFIDVMAVTFVFGSCFYRSLSVADLRSTFRPAEVILAPFGQLGKDSPSSVPKGNPAFCRVDLVTAIRILLNATHICRSMTKAPPSVAAAAAGKQEAYLFPVLRLFSLLLDPNESAFLAQCTEYLLQRLEPAVATKGAAATSASALPDLLALIFNVLTLGTLLIKQNPSPGTGVQFNPASCLTSAILQSLWSASCLAVSKSIQTNDPPTHEQLQLSLEGLKILMSLISFPNLPLEESIPADQLSICFAVVAQCAQSPRLADDSQLKLLAINLLSLLREGEE
jgi:hypothetical protein